MLERNTQPQLAHILVDGLPGMFAEQAAEMERRIMQLRCDLVQRETLFDVRSDVFLKGFDDLTLEKCFGR